jgi:hypothetical protein
MSDIIQIFGRVKHSITLDPSVWIFDDRKKKLEEFFESTDEEDEQATYVEHVAKQWDKELTEGAAPTTKSENLFVHKKDISGDWAIPFRPFLQNATPLEDSQTVICHLQNGEKVTMPLDSARESILCFALDGRPIRGTDGPVYLLNRDGSNRTNPIKGIQSFEVE